ncbi:MAG: hypothetical protein WCT04_16165 [Planctomycetota bacterium]
MSESPTFLNRAATWTRFALLAAIACVLGLIVTTPRNEYPLTMSKAQANLISAAPGYLFTSIQSGNGSQFFLVDTNKQVICVYNVTGDKLRLEAARKFDYDTDVVDGSIGLKGVIIEGGNGVSREQAKTYGDELKIKIEDFIAKIKKK